jgi:DDE superfamily endonuclease
MFEVILPQSFLLLCAAFQPCFTAPTYRTFQWLVVGWVHCPGRRTITAVAVAAGAVEQRHLSVFQRFFSRAQWSLDALGHVLFSLALAWLPADQPLYLLLDDTLARKQGKSISLATMHHDPLLSTAKKPFFSFGHVWVVLALWVPLPMGGSRGFALPCLFRLYVGAKRGGQRAAPTRPGTGPRYQAAVAAHAAHARPTKLALARELVDCVAQWAADRPLYLVVDSAYAARPLLEGRPPQVHVLSRLRADAALWARPPRRRPGQKGRPRRRGARLPRLAGLAAHRRRWDPLPLTLYGRCVTPHVFMLTALWYHVLRDHPLRIVVVRDPTGKRHDEAFFCTDLTVDAAFILTGYARRWTLEVAFHDQKQFLGFAEPQQQTARAVTRTAPLAGLVYALVLLWYASQVQQGRALGWVRRPWYRTKATPSFLDMLTALRQASPRPDVSTPSVCPRCAQNPAALSSAAPLPAA